VTLGIGFLVRMRAAASGKEGQQVAKTKYCNYASSHKLQELFARHFARQQLASNFPHLL